MILLHLVDVRKSKMIVEQLNYIEATTETGWSLESVYCKMVVEKAIYAVRLHRFWSVERYVNSLKKTLVVVVMG